MNYSIDTLIYLLKIKEILGKNGSNIKMPRKKSVNQTICGEMIRKAII